MRLFVALDIDEQIRQLIAEFRDHLMALAPEVRWVNPVTFHITLRFLGETRKLDEVRHALQQVSARPTRLSVRGAGFFPSPKAPRVFWAGIDADEHLPALVSEVAARLEPIGFAREQGPFTAHLTLARNGSGRPRPVPGERPAPGLLRVRDALAKLPPPDFGTMTAHEFCLYESHLSPAGPRYEKLARFGLH